MEKYLDKESLDQNLTFNDVEKEFENNDLIFNQNEMINLCILNKDLKYTNLGLIISDQFQHVIEVEVFQGTTKDIFKQRKVFSGSLFTQLDLVLDYLDWFNKKRAQIGKMHRVEMRDYPVSAIREALISAIVHFDYSFGSRICVNVYDDRMEFLSETCQNRNEKLDNVFQRLVNTEVYETGVVRIMNDYEGFFKQPQIIITDSSFSITLPNKDDSVVLSNIEVLALEFIREKKIVTRRDLREELYLAESRCNNILKLLENRGEILVRKNGRKLEYISKQYGKKKLPTL